MMISGDLIRLKALVDDCARVARTIQREWERLPAEERAYLAEHVQTTFPELKDILPKKAEAEPSRKG